MFFRAALTILIILTSPILSLGLFEKAHAADAIATGHCKCAQRMVLEDSRGFFKGYEWRSITEKTLRFVERRSKSPVTRFGTYSFPGGMPVCMDLMPRTCKMQCLPFLESRVGHAGFKWWCQSNGRKKTLFDDKGVDEFQLLYGTDIEKLKSIRISWPETEWKTFFAPSDLPRTHPAYEKQARWLEEFADEIEMLPREENRYWLRRIHIQSPSGLMKPVGVALVVGAGVAYLVSAPVSVPATAIVAGLGLIAMDEEEFIRCEPGLEAPDWQECFSDR